MSYYFNKTLSGDFDTIVENVRGELGKRGFGVLTEIDVKATLKKKIDVDFPRYLILGACNPSFAYKALTAENKIGTMLPCNVIVRESGDGAIEVAAVDPAASMMAVENTELESVAGEVRSMLKDVVDSL